MEVQVIRQVSRDQWAPGGLQAHPKRVVSTPFLLILSSVFQEEVMLYFRIGCETALWPYSSSSLSITNNKPFFSFFNLGSYV